MKFFGALFWSFLPCVLVAGVEAALTQADMWKLEDAILNAGVVVDSYAPYLGWVQAPKYFAQNHSETDQYTPFYGDENYKDSLRIRLTGLKNLRHLVGISMNFNGGRYKQSDTLFNGTDGWELRNISRGVHVQIRIEALVGAFEMPSFRFKNHEFYILGREQAVSFGSFHYSFSRGGGFGITDGLRPSQFYAHLGLQTLIRLKALSPGCSVAISEVNSRSRSNMYTSPVPFERVQGNRTVEFTISTAIRGSRYLIVEMRRGNQWLVRTTIIRISVAPFDGLFLRIAKLTVGCSFADFQHSTVEFGKIDVFCLSRDGFDRDVARIQMFGLREGFRAQIRFASRGEAFNHSWVDMESSDLEVYNLPMNEYPRGVVAQIQIVRNDVTPTPPTFFRTFMIVEQPIEQALFTTQLYYMKHHSVLYELDIEHSAVYYDYSKSIKFQLVVTCEGSATIEISSYQGEVLRMSGTNTQRFNLDTAAGIGYVQIIYFDPVTMFYERRLITIEPAHVKVISYYRVKYFSTGSSLEVATDGWYLYTDNEISVVVVAADSYLVEVECCKAFRLTHSKRRGGFTKVSFDTNGKEGFIVISILDGERIIVRFRPKYRILPPGAFPDATPSPKPPKLARKATSRIPRRYSLIPRRLFPGKTSTSTYASSRITMTTKITKTAPVVTNLHQTLAAPSKLVETVDITTTSIPATTSIRLRNISAVLNQAREPQRFPMWIWPLILLGVCVILAGFFFYVTYKHRPTAPQPLVELSA